MTTIFMNKNRFSLFVDTSAFYALNDPDDNCYIRACQLRKDIRISLFTSNFVIDESLTLIRMKLGHQFAVRFGTQVRESRILKVIHIDETLEETAWQIFEKYADKEYSFTDCTSFATMQKMRISDVFAFDKHFQQYGFTTHP